MRKATKLIPVALCLNFAMLASGCATIIHGTTQQVSIRTVPQGADAIIDGEQRGRTPLQVELKRNRNHMVILRKEGYKDESRPITKVLSGAVAGNLVLGGLIGGGIDLMTGAANRLVPENLVVELIKGKSGKLSTSLEDISVVERLSKLETMKYDGDISEKEFDGTRQVIINGFVDNGSDSELKNNLKQVDDLHEKGFVSDDEHEAIRKQLLSKIGLN